jgi:hypothetical protein
MFIHSDKTASLSITERIASPRPLGNIARFAGSRNRNNSVDPFPWFLVLDHEGSKGI